MKIERRYTKSGQDAYHGLDFRKAVSEIKNPDGSIVFRLADIEVPSSWSQVASDILAQKYFRKAGVPVALKRVEESTVPSWLWRSVPDDAVLSALPVKERTRGELEGSLQPSGRHLDLLGLEGRLFQRRRRCARLL